MSNLHCPRCGLDKAESEFYFCKAAKRHGLPKRQSYCKKCNSEETLERQRRGKQLAVEYKGGKCTVCGYNKCLDALQFHHTDPAEKEFTVGHKHLRSFDSIKPELDKCILLCNRCHVEEHARVAQLDQSR